MQDKPSLISHTPVSLTTNPINDNANTPQHVSSSQSLKKPSGSLPKRPRSFLLSIPGESLTHITTYVDDPPSLLALSRVNRRLRDHIADDNTWYHAFAFHFWRVGPESDPTDEKRLMLRRSESTWKKEFVKRFNITRRWEKSRSTTLSYQPHYWNVSGMHLMENLSLMTANLQYGIVTRSFPLTGKILKGHLDASGTTNGLGIGNPNEEFSPHVSCIAISSCGGTGRIAWGFRHGEVATTSAPRVMDSNRSAARFTRCKAEDEHAGNVRCVLFAGREDELVVSGCSHGQVKLWDVRRMQCLWTGFGTEEGSVVPDECVKAEYAARADVLVAAFQNKLHGGSVMLWWGFLPQDDGMGGRAMTGSVQSLRITQPATSSPSEIGAFDALFVDPSSSPSQVKIFIHHANECHFLRLVVNLPSGLTSFTRFGEGPLGPLISLKPCFLNHERDFGPSSTPLTPVTVNAPSLSIGLAAELALSRESPFVLAGDSLGRVCVWDWDAAGSLATEDHSNDVSAPDTLSQVNSCRKWEAHDDGAVCAIEINNVVIVTGSSRGTLKVWDLLTFAPLRSFTSPASKPNVEGIWDPVGQIILRGDLLVVSVGSRILAWQAGAVATNKKGKAKHAGKPKGRGVSNAFNKWQQQIELNIDIRESQRLLEDERAHVRRIHNRTRDQHATLDRLGLSEGEAIEYLLMLSREEEEQRRADAANRQAPTSTTMGGASAVTGDDTEGIFMLDDYPNVGQPRPVANEQNSSSSSGPSSVFKSRPMPRAAPSASNTKVQVSPSFIPEPSGAAGFDGSPLLLATDSPGGASPVPMGMRRDSRDSVSMLPTPTSSLDDPDAFPVMGSPPGTPIRSTPSRSVSSLQLSGSWSRGSPSSSLHSRTGGSVTGNLPPSTPSSSPGISFADRLRRENPVPRSREEEEEDELRYVLELSLAEARSRGEL